MTVLTFDTTLTETARLRLDVWLRTHLCYQRSAPGYTPAASVRTSRLSGVGPEITAECFHCDRTLDLTDDSTW